MAVYSQVTSSPVYCPGSKILGRKNTPSQNKICYPVKQSGSRKSTHVCLLSGKRPSLQLAKLPLTCWYSFALDEPQQTFHRTWYPTGTIIQNVTFSIALHVPQATFPTRHGSAIGNRTVRVERASPLDMQLPFHMKPICIQSETLRNRTFDLTGGINMILWSLCKNVKHYREFKSAHLCILWSTSWKRNFVLLSKLIWTIFY